MATPDVCARFLALHRTRDPLLLPNPWDIGSARMLASLGFSALATTSSGYAASLGRLDGSVTEQEALAHGAALAAATSLPVSADLENGYGQTADAVADVFRSAAVTGLAGCSIEDHTGHPDRPLYDRAEAVDRVAAAVAGAHGSEGALVLTARCELFLHGGTDLDEVIRRLVAYQEAGADVVYAPGLRSLDDIRAVLAAVDVPVNVLLVPGGPSVAELADAGVARISVGGMFAFAAMAGLVDAANDLLSGRADFLERGRAGRDAVVRAFGAGDGQP